MGVDRSEIGFSAFFHLPSWAVSGPGAGHRLRHENMTKYSEEEINKYRALCNFTEQEREYFELMLKGKSHICISIETNLSESQISNISRKVKSKIERVRHLS